jgi:hypothetical protein
MILTGVKKIFGISGTKKIVSLSGSIPIQIDTPSTSNWILTTGFWNDNGVWDDTANWID